MIENFFKNPLNRGIMIALVLVIFIAWLYDEKTNPSKNFYGLLKPKATV